MNIIKSFARKWLPPEVKRILLQVRNNGTRFEGEFENWEDAASRCTGYDTEHILAKVLDSTIKVKNGDAAFERDSILFNDIEYDWPVTTGLMWAAAQSQGKLNVLDFGGALGSSYFQNKKFLELLHDVQWNVVEQANYVQAGLSHIQNSRLRFYKSIDDLYLENRPNTILLSSVLQYLPDPKTIIKKIIKLGAKVIILDKTIVNKSSKNKIYVQHVPANIYLASYPCYSLSEEKLISLFGLGYRLESSFESLSFPELSRIDSQFKGFIFSKSCE